MFISRHKSHYQNFEPPFEIPDSWKWVSLPELCLIPITDGTHKTPTYSDKSNGVPFLSSKDVTSKKINWNGIKFITKELHEELYKRLAPQKNDILLAKNGTTGVAALVETDDIFDIYVTLALIRPISKYVNPKYLYNIINSPFCKKQFDSHLTGIGLPNLHLTDIQKTLIPLPPFKEQCRIVEQLNNYLSYADKLEGEIQQLIGFSTKAKSKILDLAMQGKLVPQYPTDEPAAEMLKRINPKAKIITDNPHYPKLPDNWAYISIDDVNSYESKSINPLVMPNNIFELYSVPVFSTGNPEIVLGKEIGSTKQKVEKGDVLLCKINPHLNRVWEIEKNSINVQIASSEWIVIRSTEIEPTYLKFYFESPRFRELLCSQVSGVGGSLTRAQPSVVKSYLIPIPPTNEQKRICNAIKSYLHLLDDIILHLNN